MKAVIGCVLGVVAAALLHYMFAVFNAPWIVIPLSFALIAGCLIGGMSAYFNLGRLIPQRGG